MSWHGCLRDGLIRNSEVISKAKWYCFSYYCLLIAVSRIWMHARALVICMYINHFQWEMNCHGCLKAAGGTVFLASDIRLNLNILPEPNLAPAAGAKGRCKVLIILRYKSVQHASYALILCVCVCRTLKLLCPPWAKTEDKIWISWSLG